MCYNFICVVEALRICDRRIVGFKVRIIFCIERIGCFMSTPFFKSGKISGILLSNLPGIITAAVLSAGVSIVCRYNFFVMFLAFLVFYFIVGIAAEFFIVILHIEKNKYERGHNGVKKAAKGASAEKRKLASYETRAGSLKKENDAGSEVNGLPNEHIDSYDISVGGGDGVTESAKPREACALKADENAKLKYIASCNIKIVTDGERLKEKYKRCVQDKNEDAVE